MLINSSPQQMKSRCLGSSFEFVINVMNFLDVGKNEIVNFLKVEPRNEENGE
jgi:hypothetical protein